MILSERTHKPDKLAAIRCGDEVTFLLNGVKCRGEVHGWRLSPGHEHRAIVGSARRGSYEDEVSLRSILSRFRDTGADRGLIEF